VTAEEMTIGFGLSFLGDVVTPRRDSGSCLSDVQVGDKHKMGIVERFNTLVQYEA